MGINVSGIVKGTALACAVFAAFGLVAHVNKPKPAPAPTIVISEAEAKPVPKQQEPLWKDSIPEMASYKPVPVPKPKPKRRWHRVCKTVPVLVRK